ncbi:MAG: hypothetical protein FWH37_09505 [Candidatus Bathyarchaeota archaeon]|nr:hypothetical protein [Candidatus Termiticorpusculum sp.]
MNSVDSDKGEDKNSSEEINSRTGRAYKPFPHKFKTREEYNAYKREINRRYRENHPEFVLKQKQKLDTEEEKMRKREYARQQRADPVRGEQIREYHREYRKGWNERNKEKMRVYHREWNRQHFADPVNRVKALEAQKQWRKDNPEKARLQDEARRKQRFVNKEKIAAANQKWRLANPEKVREQKKKWRKNNPEKIRDYGRRYYLKNIDKIKAKQKLDKDKINAYNRERYRLRREEELRAAGIEVTGNVIGIKYCVPKRCIAICELRGEGQICFNTNRKLTPRSLHNQKTMLLCEYCGEEFALRGYKRTKYCKKCAQTKSKAKINQKKEL